MGKMLSIDSRTRTAMPTQLTQENKQLVLFYSVAYDLVNEVKAGNDPWNSRVALQEYYLQLKELYEKRAREVSHATWHDLYDQFGLRHRMETLIGGFVCPTLRSMATRRRAMDLRRRALAGESSVIPLARRCVEQAVAIQFSVPQRTIHDASNAFYAYLTLVEQVIWFWFYDVPPQRVHSTGNQRSELGIALWALQKAVEQAQFLGEVLCHFAAEDFVYVVEKLLRRIEEDGDGYLRRETMDIRKVWEERRAILDAEVRPSADLSAVSVNDRF
jgi:hypothetical protein